MNFKRVIVTDKDVLTHDWDKFHQAKIFTEYLHEGDLILGKHQVMTLIEREAMENIKQKYLIPEVERLLSELVLVDVKDKEALERIFTHTKFVEEV